MKVIALVLAAAAAVASAHPTFSEWSETRHYRTPEERVVRQANYEANVAAIEARTAEGISHTLGVNDFADLTTAEFSSRYLGGWKGLYGRGNGFDLSHLRVNASNMPSSWDWSSKGAVTPIKNQGQCGSCWAFSATGAMEGISFIKTGNLPDLSEQQLVDCSGAEGNQGCNGGLPSQGFEYVVKNGGICSESEYPYTASDGKCKASSCKDVATISGYTNVPTDSESAMMSAVVQQPVSIGVDASGLDWQFYMGGVVTSSCGTQLDHGVLAVGFGSSGGQDFWKVKNSWGASWGMSGYIELGRGSSFAPHGQCGMLMMPVTPTKN